MKARDIDWKLVADFQELKKIDPKLPLKVRESEYDKCLVVPNYQRIPNIYLVKKVCKNVNPESPMGNPKYKNFVDYYKIRHDINISNLSQPLLEVKTIPRDFNLIRKKCVGESKFTPSNKNHKEYFVPEICCRINFPSIYYLKASTLPSVLHRINRLLIAEELRLKIAKIIDLPLENNLKPLVIDENDNDNDINSSLLNDSIDEDEEFLDFDKLKISNEISGKFILYAIS